MKFLWIVKRDWKHPGPIVHVALRNAHALAKVGHECHFILGEGVPSFTDADLSNFYGLEKLENFHIHRIKREGLFASRPIINYAIKLALSLKGHERITLITRETSYLPAFAKINRDAKFRTLYETHDFFTKLSWKKNTITLQDRRNQFLEKKFIPHISGIICITEEQARLYQSAYPVTPAIALPLGTEPRQPSINSLQRLAQRRVVYVGHLNTYKGTRELLKCAGQLHKKLSVITAFWGGTQAQIERIFKPEILKKHSSHIEFLPFRPPSELSEDLATQATLGVLPLTDTYYNRYLTCPVKALDYISHGLPVVATNLPTNRWLLQDAAIYYPPGKKHALIDAVAQALEPETYFALCKAAHRRANELSYNHRAKNIAKFAKQLHFSSCDKLT
jgi:glycosyltransferase involved in cell wall biosynthesis